MRVILGFGSGFGDGNCGVSSGSSGEVTAPAPVMAPVWNWTGFYIGVNGGYSWGRSSRDLNFFNPLNGVLLATRHRRRP